MPDQNRKYSISVLFFVIFALIISINVFLIFIATNEYKKELIQAKTEEKVHLAEAIGKTLSASTIRQTPINQLFISEIAKTKDMVFVRVVGSDGKIELSSISNEQGQEVKAAQNISQLLQGKEYMRIEEIFKEERIFTIFYPAENKLVLLGFSTGAIEKPIAKLQRYSILIALAGTVLFVLFLAFFLQVVVKPIKKLISACKNIEKGNLKTQVDIKSKSEIGDLGASFNEMAKNLDKSQTSLQRARLKAEEERNKTLTVITNLVDGLLVFNKRYQLDYINPRAEAYLGVKTENVLNKSGFKLREIPSFKRIIQLLDKLSKETVKEELSFKKSLILEVIATPMVLRGQTMGIIVILHDITREKHIEEMKTEFVSLTAHQLRTPLSAIKWALRMLLDQDLGSINPDQKSFLQKTYSSNERMIHLINDLLNVTKIEEGRFLYQQTKAQLEEIVKNVASTFEEKMKMKNINFSFKKPEKKLPPVIIDPEKMEIAITNLLDNAIDYTPEKGKISISLSTDANNVKFMISDTGVGIPEEHQPRIFSKFFRAENVMKMDTEGTGLGMFITKNIIEAHGGKIWFESKEDKGTSFYFIIPIK